MSEYVYQVVRVADDGSSYSETIEATFSNEGLAMTHKAKLAPVAEYDEDVSFRIDRVELDAAMAKELCWSGYYRAPANSEEFDEVLLSISPAELVADLPLPQVKFYPHSNILTITMHGWSEAEVRAATRKMFNEHSGVANA